MNLEIVDLEDEPFSEEDFLAAHDFIDEGRRSGGVLVHW
jgi:hypothetical protein